MGWAWPTECIKPLAAGLRRKRLEVNRDEFDLGSLQLLTIHFDGQIEPRDLAGKDTFKGKLFFSHANDVVYSRIDVRNGAIGVVPETMPVVVVSGEYPVYEVVHGVALPEYVKLLFRTQRFRVALNSMISGASGRKRVQPEQLESMEVPFPPIETQSAIVSHWQQAQEEIAAATERVEQFKQHIDSRFFAELGLKAPRQTMPPKAFAVSWKEFFRWSVSYNQQVQSGTDITTGRFPIVALGMILDMVQYGTSEKANTSGEGVPVIRMNNIVDGQLDFTDLKHVSLPKSEEANLLLLDGDILINRTNSKELVGKCAVFHAAGKFVFASYLIRLRTDTRKAIPDFVTYALNSPLGRQQIDALSRQIIGQANINTEEIRSLQIPLPPVGVQHDIMRRVEEGRAEIAREREAAERRAREIEAEVEGMILGTRKPSIESLQLPESKAIPKSA